MQGGVLMGSKKPPSIVAMLRIFVLPTTVKGGVGYVSESTSQLTVPFAPHQYGGVGGVIMPPPARYNTRLSPNEEPEPPVPRRRNDQNSRRYYQD